MRKLGFYAESENNFRQITENKSNETNNEYLIKALYQYALLIASTTL